METLLRAMGEVVQIATADVRKMNGTTRTHIDLFSGIGGFALACRWAGIETIAFCEIEKYAQRVLRKNFSGIRIFEDVRQFPATEFREPFLLTGGYPCQPFSQAGKRRGAEDDRHLWPSMFGIIRTSRPTWILAENVAGHVTLGLDEVLADLESEDYAVQPIIVPACAVDAPHRRDRVWILANAKSHGLQGRTQSKDGERYFKQDGTTDKPSGTSSGDSSRILGNATSKLGDECGKYKETSRRQIPELRNASRVKQWRTKSIQSELVTAECGNRWSAEPNVGRVAHGIPRRVDRLRGLGNAIVPQVAYEIIKAMIEADESA
jgi:DNA (cytosine-5)-methyltransferase 1